MKRVLGAGLIVALSLGWLAARWDSAGPLAVAADAPASKDKAADKKSPSGSASDQQESNRVKYARTYLALAKLDLQMPEARNKEVPETLPPALILVFEENVHLAELALEQEQAEVAGNSPLDAAVKMA